MCLLRRVCLVDLEKNLEGWSDRYHYHPLLDKIFERQDRLRCHSALWQYDAFYWKTFLCCKLGVVDADVGGSRFYARVSRSSLTLMIGFEADILLDSTISRLLCVDNFKISLTA